MLLPCAIACGMYIYAKSLCPSFILLKKQKTKDFYVKSLAMKEKIANFAGDLEVP